MKKTSKKTSHRTSRKWRRQQRHKIIDCKDAAAERRYIFKNTTKRRIKEYEYDEYE
jgi:hypothetical protein